MPTAVLSDTFPAIATLPDGRSRDRIRVIVFRNPANEQETLLILQDSADGPKAVYSQPLSSYTKPKQAIRLKDIYNPDANMHTATLSAGDGTQTVTWLKSTGCGCGSRLKSFNPFTGIASVDA